MSLFSSIQMAGNTLQANDIALQVTGQNLANANTPGYIREMANLTPGPTQQVGSLNLGTGVSVTSVTQDVDKFLQTRLNSATADQASADTLQQTYNQLETVLGSLSSTSSLGAMMNQFYSSIAAIQNDPQDESVRATAAMQGQALTQNVNQLFDQADQLRESVNSQIDSIAPQVNDLLTQINQLNGEIVAVTAGNTSASDAVGLTDQRDTAVSNLAQLIGTTATEQTDGSVAIYSGGEYLVYEGNVRSVSVASSSNRGMTVSTIQINGINAPLDPASGQLQGLITSRDTVLGGFEDQLNSFAGTLANEFNKVYSSGQGLTGFTSMSAQDLVSDASAPLDNAGLSFTPTNGSFQVVVTNTQTGVSTTTNVPVDLLDTGQKTTLASLAATLNSVSGIQATISSDGQLSIASTDSNTQFSFANDTSGVLASLGLNTFFTGSTASGLAVNSAVLDNPATFAASTAGIGTDTTNAATLANFLDLPLASQGGNSIGTLYNNLTNNVAESSSAAQAASSAADTFQSTLNSQALSVSGVNVDEEIVQMMQYQQSYTASARYITTLDSLLQTLIQI